MKGIVSFDMDMTLLNHADYKIPDSAIKALGSASQKLLYRDRYRP